MTIELNEDEVFTVIDHLSATQHDERVNQLCGRFMGMLIKHHEESDERQLELFEAGERRLIRAITQGERDEGL